MKRLRDDSGIAMVTAIMAGLVVLTLSVAGFELAKHNLDSSAGHRRGVQSVHAAEAGVDSYLDYLANTAPIAAPVCELGAQDLNTDPGTGFTSTATFYASSDGTGTPLASPGSCTTFASVPKSAVITSQGISGGKTRTMKTLVQLDPNTGRPLATTAVFAGGSATWTGQASVTNAPGTELTADLYSNVNLDLKGGGTVYGYVESQGTVKLSGTTIVNRDVTARSTLTTGNNATIAGNARSTTASISNGGVIQGNAIYCTGSPPSGVNGTKTQGCDTSLPAQRNFTAIGYDASDWTSNSPFYTEATGLSACPTSAQLNALTGNKIVRLTNCPTFTIPNVQLKGHLAIISTADIRTTGSSSITRSTGTDPAFALHLMANVPTAPTLANPATCGANSGISVGAGTSFPAGVDLLFYTPCDVKFTGNATASIQGQIVAGRDVDFSSGSNITYKPVLIPTTNPVGFRESVRYRSEIKD